MADDHGDVEGESWNSKPGNIRPCGSILCLRNRKVMNKLVRCQGDGSVGSEDSL